jgi:selenium donor protein
MRPYLETFYGNPSSSHWYGVQTKQAITKARQQVAGLIGCNPEEILFTSGGSESNNYAIKGIALANRNKGNHIITSMIEHPAVIEVCRYLEKQDFQVTYLPVDSDGFVSPVGLKKAITPNTILITIMHANNEVGTIQPIAEMSRIARHHGIPFHTDAAQSVGKISVTINDLDVDLLTIAGHKLYAPKGIGVLYIRRGLHVEKQIHGASHEFNMRAGTENVLEIAGLGAAAEWIQNHIVSNTAHLRHTRDRLEGNLIHAIPGLKINGHPRERLPNTLNVSFPGIDANTLLDELREEVAASAGAACHSDSVVVSSVLKAMGLPDDLAFGTIRFSTGHMTTIEEVDRASQNIIKSYQRIKSGDNSLTIPDQATVKLTQFTHGLGCACKLRPQDLKKIIANLSPPEDSRLLVGPETSDDAAVYRIADDLAIVQTVDFFTPIVDDPFTFGAIAAVNALSDIYAMGAKPLWALNLVAFPVKRLPLSVLETILLGAQSIAVKAGISIVGGHTIEDTEPKYGLCVSGIVHPEKILRNHTARHGDALFLTKPLGTGVISTAMKRMTASSIARESAIQSMLRLNDDILRIMELFTVTACTDVTGFGLMGHLLEMTGKGKTSAEIQSERIPVLPDVHELILSDNVPGGTMNNHDYVKPYLEWHSSVSRVDQIIMCDAQTSGGLLFTVLDDEKQKLIDYCKENDIPLHYIGRITAGHKIIVM